MENSEKECQKQCDKACAVFAGSLIDIVAVYGFNMVERCLKRTHKDLKMDEDEEDG